MGNYLKKPIIDEAVQSGRLGTINFASNTIQVSKVEFGHPRIPGIVLFKDIRNRRLPLELFDFRFIGLT